MKITICFTGGGTAGHVFPGMAVLESFSALCRQRGIEADFFWIGSSSGMEKKLVGERNIRFYGIQTGKLRRYFSFRNFTDIFRIKMGILKSFYILSKRKPSLIFSKGGYVSVPPVFAGRILGIPVISHESDFTPGLATRINQRFSSLIMLSFSETADYISRKYRDRVLVAGNPVREIFHTADAGRGRQYAGLDENIPVIMVLGGSQGAREINSLVEKNLHRLLACCYVVHQSGDNEICCGAEVPAEYSHRYKRYPFLGTEIADIMKAADVVISRAGAGTIWELSSLGKASVIIPLRGSGTRGDQVMNASFLKSKGAALVIDDDVITPDTLYSAVTELLSDTGKKSAMGRECSSLGSSGNAGLIAEKILSFCGVRSE